MYSIGDRFIYDEQEYILVQVDENRCALINLKTGNRWNNPITVEDNLYITESEFDSISYEYRCTFTKI